MPAREETYRDQRPLHIVFAVSSVLMFLSIIWMIAQDHFREWKTVQRDFVKLDAAKTKRDAEDAKLLASHEEFKQLDEQLAEAKRAAASEVKEAEAAIGAVKGKVQKTDETLAFRKARRDSIQSFYDIEIDNGREDKAKAIKVQLDKLDEELLKLRAESENLNDKLAAAEKQKSDAQKANKVTDLEKQIAGKKKERDRVAGKEWSIQAAIRSSPILDAFAPALKIEQMVLSDLPIHYSFKGVPRFDRCTTCHKGIDAVTKEGTAAFDPAVVDQLSASPHRAAFRTHPHPELFAGPNSPHPREKMGCTICHLGQGSSTSFLFASHTPNSSQQMKDWKENKEKNLGWYEVHDWPWQMNKSRFVESGCVKCHPYVVDLDSPTFGETAPKLLKGYNIVRQYGCFGCHEINGWKNGRLIGPDLRIEPQSEEERKKAEADLMNPPGRMRKVGPSLRHIADKVPTDWTYRWVKLPKGFRPGTRMPQFYDLSNNSGDLAGSDAADVAKSAVELHAIVHYLYSNSQPAAFRDIPDGVSVAPKDAEQTKRGRDRFIERGCLACHSHKGVDQKDYPQANATFGPDLSNVAAKLHDKDGNPNTKWLFNWLKDPLAYHSTSFMPNLQLKNDEAADIAAWLLSIAGAWDKDPGRPALDDKVLDDMLRMFLQKSMTLKKTDEVLGTGLSADDAKEIRGDEKLLTAPMSKEKKLTYLGRKTISRMGCFGCHDIPGFETAKPIGTELTSWGLKARMDPDKLAFEHITEYLETPAFEKEKHSNPDFEMFAEEMHHHKGEAFLWQKLRDPRSYDYNKLKAWDEKLRMPRFPFADDPASVEAVMTFVLGLVGDDQIPQHYRNVPQSGPSLARIEGQKAMAKFNCQGCHMTKMPEFTFDLSKAEVPDPEAQHRDDFAEVAADQAAMKQTAQPKGGKLATINAMFVDSDATVEQAGKIPADATELAFDLWEPAVINGKQYYVGDRFAIAAESVIRDKTKEAEGGQFAELLLTHMMRQGNKKVREVWGFVPPPLVREGMKAQPAWLHQFLLNPIELRPAVRLRMPRFNMSSDEAAGLAGYFAAADNMKSPYEQIHERDETYIAQMESQHPNYLKDGWKLLTLTPDVKAGVTDKLCASCHTVGNKLAGGAPEERGPNLYLTADRLRSDWLRQWIMAPKRILPYTGMPNNFSAQPRYQEQFPGTSVEQIGGVRDALINYHKVQASELVAQPSTQPSTGGN